MRLNVDTNTYEDISIKLSDEEYEADLASNIEEFCYAMASFIVDFSKGDLGCNKERALSFKDLCLSCIDKDVSIILDEIEAFGKYIKAQEAEASSDDDN